MYGSERDWLVFLAVSVAVLVSVGIGIRYRAAVLMPSAKPSPLRALTWRDRLVCTANFITTPLVWFALWIGGMKLCAWWIL